ncbi:DUF4440 domain-containing protein [Streptomyces sp. NPDC002788]
MPEHDPAVEAAIEGELALLDPDVRRFPERVGALLHPEFHEFGASGRRWSRAAILAALAETTDLESPPVVTSQVRGVRLAPDLVHLTAPGVFGVRVNTPAATPVPEGGTRTSLARGIAPRSPPALKAADRRPEP